MKNLWLACCLWLACASAYAAPQLQGRDVLTGQAVNLAQLRSKDQTVLLVFFKAGCNTCVYNFKLIREFYQANKNSRFQVIGVGLDRKPELFRSYAELVRATSPKMRSFRCYGALTPRSKINLAKCKAIPPSLCSAKTATSPSSAKA
ncbi:peroxiredoxin family protein [Chitinibacter tainanensis]|uniref:peroxiredoxin family protein n=1 Tax=Chitinibacter tainanensis TaxID=230667 RepID=UPI000424FB67|nr:redoxin domain-containing protein [Chitinibacter tainanensis]